MTGPLRRLLNKYKEGEGSYQALRKMMDSGTYPAPHDPNRKRHLTGGTNDKADTQQNSTHQAKTKSEEAEKGNKVEPAYNTQNIASLEAKTQDSHEAGLDKRVQGGGAGLDEKVQGLKTQTNGAIDFKTKANGDGVIHQTGNGSGDRSEGIGDRGGELPQAKDGGASQEIFQSHLVNRDVLQTKTKGIGGNMGRGRQVPGHEDRNNVYEAGGAGLADDMLGAGAGLIYNVPGAGAGLDDVVQDERSRATPRGDRNKAA